MLMSSLGYADEESPGERSYRELSPTPSTDTQTGHPRGTRSVAKKCRGSSQTTSDRLVASYLQLSTFHCRFANFDLCFCFFKSGS